MIKTVLGYGDFVRVGDIKGEYTFFPQLYSWGRHDAFVFRLRESDMQLCKRGLLQILELRESEWHYTGNEWDFFPWEEEVKKVLRFYALIDFPGICFALYRVYGDESVKEKDFILEYRAKDEEEYKPLIRLRLRDEDYVEMFETAQITFFVYEAIKVGWRIKFI